MSNLRTPLFHWHTAAKARMVPFGGWDMPVQYAGIAAEHKAVRIGAGLFDISHMARVDFTGVDALKLLEKVFTNSVASMKVGQVRYGLVCRDDGGILDDILVYKWPTSYSAVVNAGNREKIAAWLDTQRTGLTVEVKDQTFETAMVAIQGPKAVELVVGLFADNVSGLRYYFAQQTRYKDKPCVVSRTGYTGEDGFEAIVPNSLALTLWEDLIAGGATPCGLGARDTLRLEAAMPLYGHELNETIDPIRAGLAWAVKLDKGDFIGREALRAATADHTKPVRVGLEIEGNRAAREGSTLTDPDNTPAGTITSGSFCPWLDKSLAMAYVRPELSYVGTPLDVEVRGSTLSATVVPLPFYKRAK